MQGGGHGTPKTVCVDMTGSDGRPPLPSLDARHVPPRTGVASREGRGISARDELLLCMFVYFLANERRAISVIPYCSLTPVHQVTSVLRGSTRAWELEEKHHIPSLRQEYTDTCTNDYYVCQ